MSTDSPNPQTPKPSNPPILFKLILWTRFLSAIAVVSSLVATLLMLLIGANNTLKAVELFLAAPLEATGALEPGLEPGEEIVLLLLESLDNFLVGLAFVYFAYGIYSLFIRLKQNQEDGMPQWLKVSNIAILKKTLLEILVVLLSVTFVRGMLHYTATEGLIAWDALVYPISIVALALSLKLMELDKEE